MKLSDFRQPATLAEATAVLKELGDKAMPLAGGTALHFLTTLKDKIAVDISGLGFNKITDTGSAFEIGATTIVSDLMKTSPGFVLGKVAKTLSTNQIRHMATVGGNIVSIFPWADFPVALLALDGEASICGNSDRNVAFDEYFKGQPSRLFEAGDLLKSIKVSKLKSGEGFGYHKEVRTAAGFSMATSAAKVKVADGKIETVRVAVGACIGIPRRLTEVEDALKGIKADWNEINAVVVEQTKSRKWKSIEAQGVEYTAHLAKTVITDAIFEACSNAEKGA
jgi:carbon-monoxide dehydrogenase medium subunit